MAKKKTSQPATVSRNDARKAASDAAGESAKAAQETARAAQAEARTRQLAVEAQIENDRAANALKKADFDKAAAKEASENSYGAKAIQIGMNVAAAGGGYVLGKKLADKIDSRHVKTMAQRKTQSAALAKVAGKITGEGKWDKARIRAVASTARTQGLTSIRGPVGLVSAGILLAEGAASRYMATQIKNESAAEAFRSLSTSSVFAAASLLGTRVVQNATPSVLPSAVDTMQIRSAQFMAKELQAADKEKARAVKQAAKASATAAPASKRAAASKVAKAAVTPKALPIPAGHPSQSAFSRLMGKGAQVGATAATKVGVSAAAKTIAGGLTVGGVVLAAATGYDAGAGAAQAAGLGGVKKNIAGGATAAGVVVAGYGLAKGVTKGVTYAGSKLAATGVGKYVTKQAVAKVGAKLALRAVPYVGTALLLGDAIRLARAGLDLVRNSPGNQKRIAANARAGAQKTNRAIMASRAAKGRVAPVSDGMVNAHYRKQASGKMTYVKAYAVPK